MSKLFECTKSIRLAHEGAPHLPQTVLFSGMGYDVPNECCEEHARLAESLECGELVEYEVEEETLEPPSAESDASYDTKEDTLESLEVLDAVAVDEQSIEANESDSDSEQPFDLDNASIGELRAFVKADDAMNDVVDLRGSADNIRDAILAYYDNLEG